MQALRTGLIGYVLENTPHSEGIPRPARIVRKQDVHVSRRQSLNSLSSRWRRSRYGSESACEDGAVALGSVMPCISACGRLCAHRRVKTTINPAPFTMTNNGKSQAVKAKPRFGGAARSPSPPISTKYRKICSLDSPWANFWRMSSRHCSAWLLVQFSKVRPGHAGLIRSPATSCQG